MARTLQFTHAGRTLACAIEKVDRGRLYGSRSLETLDNQGRPCTLATLAADGHTLIPMGGTAIGHIGPDGRWIESEALTAVDGEGAPLPRIASSFEAPIPLEHMVSVDVLLEHSIRLTYALMPLEGPLDAGLDSALAAGAIFSFPFSWRGGVASDPAFLVRGEDGTVWLLIGDGRSLAWSHEGYRDDGARLSGPLTVLTPPATLAILSAGYRPMLHATAFQHLPPDHPFRLVPPT